MTNSEPLPVPTSDECTLALLAHVLQVIAWFIAPLIIFLMRRQSRFVAFHALQALIWQAVLMGLGIVTTVGAFAAMILALLHAPAAAHARSSPPPVAMFVFFPLVWVFWMGGWAMNIVLAIVYGLKSSRGEWAEYPVIGRLARRLAHV
jgi:uncharacterized membrane protein